MRSRGRSAHADLDVVVGDTPNSATIASNIGAVGRRVPRPQTARQRSGGGRRPRAAPRWSATKRRMVGVLSLVPPDESASGQQQPDPDQCGSPAAPHARLCWGDRVGHRIGVASAARPAAR